MNRQRLAIGLVLGWVLLFGGASAVTAQPAAVAPTATILITGLAGGAGSTVGPDGALYVPEPRAGRIVRVNPQTGAVTTFASGLPRTNPDIGIGGPTDVGFLGATAYALVTLVGADTGGKDVVGLYRIDGPDRSTVIADIGAFSQANPPRTEFFVATGVQYAMTPYQGGFLVSDGHLNRVLMVTLDGKVREVIAFGNTAPTGLAVAGKTVYLGEAGPVPHRPQDGRVVAFEVGATTATPVLSGAPLVVDVALGRDGQLFVLAQGEQEPGLEAGAPANPNAGSLVLADGRGGFTVVYAPLDRPTSLTIIGDTAYVVTLGGTIVKIAGLPGTPAPPATGSGGNLPGLPNTGAGGGSPQPASPLAPLALGALGGIALLLVRHYRRRASPHTRNR